MIKSRTSVALLCILVLTTSSHVLRPDSSQYINGFFNDSQNRGDAPQETTTDQKESIQSTMQVEDQPKQSNDNLAQPSQPQTPEKPEQAVVQADKNQSSQDQQSPIQLEERKFDKQMTTLNQIRVELESDQQREMTPVRQYSNTSMQSVWRSHNTMKRGISPLNLTQLEEQRNQSLANKMTYDQFLHYKRKHYQHGNYSKVKSAVEAIEAYWSDPNYKPESHLFVELEKQKNRTNQDKHVTVHWIVHSHDDVGWRKTADEYFTGAKSKNGYCHISGVKFILDSMYEALMADPKRKMTYVEMKFFTMWYKNLSDQKKQDVKKLIQTGQLEITQGGWSATDEACPNYEDLILNMYLGHQFLQKEFGIRPTVGWMIDAFGHSSANAALFSDFGFEALFFARGHDPENEEFREQKKKGQMSFIWKPMNRSFGDEKEIYTHQMAHHYEPPIDTLNWDSRSDTDTPIVNETDIYGYNIQQKVAIMVNFVQDQIEMFPQKENVMVMFGSDFTNMNGYTAFQQTDMFIELFNKYQQRNMTIKYSTPSEFVKASMKENITWQVNYRDYMPFASEDGKSWSGFYTSRPGLKKQAKSYSSLFHAQSRLFARRMINQKSSDSDIDRALKAQFDSADPIGVVQHHDGITGTSIEYVANDYAWHMFKGFNKSRVEINDDLNKRVKQMANIDLKPNSLKQCKDFMQNDTVVDCPIELDKNSKEFLVVIQNQQTQNRDHLIRILAPGPNYKPFLWDSQANDFLEVAADVFEQRHMDKEGEAFLDSVIYIKANIQSDQLALIKLVKQDKPYETPITPEEANKPLVQGKSLTVQGVSETGYILFQYTNKEEDVDQTFGINIKKYNAKNPTTTHNLTQAGKEEALFDSKKFTDWEWLNQVQGDGPYYFRPAWDDPMPHPYGKVSEDVLYQKGKLLEQWTFKIDDPQTKERAIVRARFSELFNDMMEFDVELAPIPIDDGRGKDVTVNFKMFNGFDAKGRFWTDSNGLEMQERNIQVLPTPYAFLNKLTSNFIMTGQNYFPVTSAIMMRDQNQSNIQVTVMNDRSQGGSADLTDKATIELMQHRRLNTDDDRGVMDAMNETDNFDHKPIRVNARYFMQIINTKKGVSRKPLQQIETQQPLQYFFASQSDYVIGPKQGIALPHKQSLVSLNKFPDSVTQRLFPVAKNKILVRFENLADNIEINQQGLETQFLDLESFAEDLYMDENQQKPENFEIQEMRIQGVYPLEEKQKIWRTVEDKSPHLQQLAQDKQGFKGIALEPQRIRTFQITYNQPADSLKAQLSEKDKMKKSQPAGLAVRDMIRLNAEKFEF